MTNTDTLIEMTNEAVALADRYAFEANEDFDGYARVGEDGSAAVFRVRNHNTASVQVEVVGLSGSRSLVELEGAAFLRSSAPDPAADYLDALDEALTAAFRAL